MDKIEIKDLQIPTLIGVYDSERTSTQPILISLVLHCDLSASAESDRLTDTLDYGSLVRSVKDYVAGTSFQLIEALAYGIFYHIFDTYQIDIIDLIIKKPQAISTADYVKIELTRRRQDMKVLVR